MRLSSLSVLFFWVLGGTHAQDLVREGFEHDFVHELDGPTDLEWLPDGNLLAAEKNGKLWFLEGAATGLDGDKGSVKATLAMDMTEDLDVCINGGRGLSGIAAHPNFIENRFVYLCYVHNKNGNCDEDENDGPVIRVSRFVLKENNKINKASELVFFDSPSMYMDHHQGGDLNFGNDGNLWVSTGDAGVKNILENPRDKDLSWQQDPANLFGKILRFTEDGDIPKDNPYVGKDGVRCNENGMVPKKADEAAKCVEVFASGLRNPFKFAMDPNSSKDKVRFFINDVGGKQWEETSEGGTDFPGVDYGYPVREGPCPRGETTGCKNPPSEYTDPVHFTQHSSDGGARTGGAFVPDGIGWPAEFDGAYMYADYVDGRIYQLVYGGKGHGCRNCKTPTSDYISSDFTLNEWRDQITSIEFGPWGENGDKAMYYLSRGWGKNGEIEGLFRISYVDKNNRKPKVEISAEPTFGKSPLIVKFDGTASTDPDGDVLSYEWDFDNDGKVDSTEPIASFEYTEAGMFEAQLVVRDGNGGKTTGTIRIDVDNTPPDVTIVNPPEGATFAVGDIFNLTAEGTDHEHGILSDSAFVWEVRQHHQDHYHPFLDSYEGNYVPLQQAPSPEDYYAATNSYLEILLTAYDKDGLKTTVTRNVMPRLVEVTIDAAPLNGVEITVDGESLSTPVVVTSWENHSMQVEAPAIVEDNKGSLYSLVSWTGGKSLTDDFIVPKLATTLVATYDKLNMKKLEKITSKPTDDAVLIPGREANGLREGIFVDKGNDAESLIRFEVPSIDEGMVVARAVLRLFSTLKSSDDGGTVMAAKDVDWKEGSVTSKKVPKMEVEIGSIGEVEPDNWYDIDVTGAKLDSDTSTVTFLITDGSSKRAVYRSKEHPDGNGPELVLYLAPLATNAPTPVPTQTHTSVPPTSVPSTAAPSFVPTSAPTTSPTSLPTLSPTSSPTLSPTSLPTLSPTSLPTLSPVETPLPSPLPTSLPTHSPVETFMPTSSPTMAQNSITFAGTSDAGTSDANIKSDRTMERVWMILFCALLVCFGIFLVPWLMDRKRRVNIRSDQNNP